jgi:hypothetical protein
MSARDENDQRGRQPRRKSAEKPKNTHPTEQARDERGSARATEPPPHVEESLDSLERERDDLWDQESTARVRRYRKDVEPLERVRERDRGLSR